MLYAIFGTIVPLAAIALFTVWGLIIGIKNVRVRFTCVALSFIIAIILAFVVKNLQTTELLSLLDPMLRSTGNEALVFIADSQPLHEVVAVCGGALLAPWVFLVTFVVFNVIAWIFCMIAFLVSALVHGKKEEEEDADFSEDEEEYCPLSYFMNGFVQKEEKVEEIEIKAPKKRPFLRILFYSVAQVALTLFVILTPVVSTLDYLPGIVIEADQSGALKKLGEKQGTTLNADLVLGEIDKVEKTPAVSIYRKLGGSAFCNIFEHFIVAGRASDLNTEMTAIAELGFDIFRLYELQIEDYTDEEVVLLREIDKDLHDSVFLPVVSGEFLMPLRMLGWMKTVRASSWE